MRGTSSSEKAVTRRAASAFARRGLVERPQQRHERRALAQARDRRVVGGVHAEREVGGPEQRRAVGLDPRARGLVVRVARARGGARPGFDANFEARLTSAFTPSGTSATRRSPASVSFTTETITRASGAYGRDTIGDGTRRAQG